MFANTLSSLICNDFISPIAVINNAIDLQTLPTQDNSDAEVFLIMYSYKNVSKLIKFFMIMITFDQNDEGQAVYIQRVQAILKPLLHCKYESQHCIREGILSHREPKAIFLSVLCLEAGMPREEKLKFR